MGVAELQQSMEAPARRASALRDALERSHGNTESMVGILGSFDNRLAAVEAAMRPVQVRTHAAQMAHEKIDRTIEVAEAIRSQFDVARQAEAMILKGPHEGLGSFLDAVDILKGIVCFFSSNKNLKSSEGILNHVNNLLTKSALMIEEEFRQLMGTYSQPVELDCLPKPQTTKGDSEAVEEQPSKSLKTALYMNPTLIPPTILLLLHDIALQLVQGGNQQSCYRIYRLFVDEANVFLLLGNGKRRSCFEKKKASEYWE